MKMIITVEGGLIQNITTDTKISELDLSVIDYDTEGAEVEDLNRINGIECFLHFPSVTTWNEEEQKNANSIEMQTENERD
jgi:hypothetical protein